jgi:aerobic carbon-monoxide dehydrogenase small subunit
MARLTVNGQAHNVDVDPNTPLLWVLREQIGLTGTKYGCGIAQCGSCTVHIADMGAVRSCSLPISAAEGKQVTTIEGLAQNGKLHPMQEAFRENHGLQCGFCTPGMIMTAVDLVQRKGNSLDDKIIREELEGNICRCTGYHNIVKSIAAGAKAMA